VKPTGPIRVLVVLDSPFVRAALTRALAEQPGLEVAGSAKDAFEARELIIARHPDVIVLDVDLPRVDGLSFLKKLRAHYPVPVIMCSERGPAGARSAVRAMELGATDVVAKPATADRTALRRLAEELTEKIRAAHVALPVRPPIPPSATAKPTSFRATGLDPNRYVIAVGASTGGTEAVKDMLLRVPVDFPPVVIVQHMPEGFTKSFADRLDQLSPLSVKEAQDHDLLTPGRAFLARGGIQMGIRPAAGGRWRIAYGSRAPVNRHCPAVDVLFESVAQYAGPKGIGVLLTGMGSDGARGLLRMRGSGALTVAQSHSTCVVYGMPKVAVELGAVELSVAPLDMPAAILTALLRREHAGSRPSAAAAQPVSRTLE